MTRNVFDQYKDPENRLTHAIFASLANDEKLLQRFLREIARCPGTMPGKLKVEEQRLPGEAPATEEEAIRRGLPDAWIHDDDSWSVLVECKVASPVRNDQLRRHLATAERRGFEVVRLLVIGVQERHSGLPSPARYTSWGEVYLWLRKQRDSEWAERAAEYMEIAETRMIDSGYLVEGTVTKFTGFSFGPDEEYSYPEAKRLLGLAMGELRRRRDLARMVGANLAGAGRPAITGRAMDSVWDFIPLKEADESVAFTKYPHLTLSLHRDRVLPHVTLPHGMRTEFRKNLRSLGEEGFVAAVLEVERNLRSVLRGVPEAAPWFSALQRHYKSQRSPATIDAKLEFDLRTAVDGGKKKRAGGVKEQSQWLRVAYDVMTRRQSNYQVALGAIFPYVPGSKIREDDALDLVAGTWIACKPLLAAALGR